MTTWRALIKYIHGVNLIITGHRNRLSIPPSLSCDYGWYDCEKWWEKIVSSFTCFHFSAWLPPYISFTFPETISMWNNLSGATVSHLLRRRHPVRIPCQIQSTASLQKAVCLSERCYGFTPVINLGNSFSASCCLDSSPQEFLALKSSAASLWITWIANDIPTC